MKKLFTSSLLIYQKIFSPDQGLFRFNPNKTCGFYPSCSEYARQAVIKYGALKGCWLGVKRILRCHPWQKNYFNPLK